MTGNVQERSPARRLSESASRSRGVEQHGAVWKRRGQSLDFVLHKWGHLVGDAYNARPGIFNVALLQAVFQNGSARRIGNIEVVDNVSGAVVKGVEGQEVQASMRDDRDVARSDTAGDRGKKISMEFRASTRCRA